MFDSTIGRWQSKDPKSFDAGDTNLYRYVGNHPSYATDPSGLEEPYVGPSIEILNSHKDAGGLDYQIRKVSSSELDQLYAAGLVSKYAYFEAQDLLSLHSRVRVAISHRLRNGIRAIEGATRVNGAIEAAAGAVEAAEGVVLLVPTVGGSFVMVVHGLDHTQAGTRSMFTGIDQNTFVATGAEYVGEHGLGLDKESARSLGQLTELGSDIVVPIATIRFARMQMLDNPIAYAPSSVGGLDAWLAAGQQGGLRRNIAAWRLNNFRNNSTRYYGVFSDDAAARLAAGGEPWPTGMSRANLGEGLYVWGSRTDAASYLQLRQANPAFDAAARGTRIRSFRVGNRDLGRFSRLDLRNVDEATFQRFIDNHTAYADNFSPHGFQYVIYRRAAGV